MAANPVEQVLSDPKRYAPTVRIGPTTMDLYHDGIGGLVLDHIRTDPAARGKGHGTKALQQLLRAADKRQMPVHLTVGQPDEDRGSEGPSLTQWYTKHGFKETGEGNYIDGVGWLPKMTRLPANPVAKLSRGFVASMLDSLGPPRDKNTDNPYWFHNGHFIKQTSDGLSATEQLISQAFRDTKTPGAIKTRTIKHGGKTYSISPLVQGGQELGDVDTLSPRHLADTGNILLSELLTHTQDRHVGNYMVSPTQVHSIDHELGLAREQSQKFPSKLYEQAVRQGHDPVASREHLRRWIDYVPKYTELLSQHPWSAAVKHSHLPEFHKLLSKASEVAGPTGVPIKQLIPDVWHVKVHGVARDS